MFLIKITLLVTFDSVMVGIVMPNSNVFDVSLAWRGKLLDLGLLKHEYISAC